MIIFGHPYFEHKPFYDVSSIDAILQTPPNSNLYIEMRASLLDVIEHAKLNTLSFALKVNSLKEALFAHNFQARYIICTPILAPQIQKAADTYLFDAKVLVQIQEESEIEEMASLGIDGVIFNQAVIKTIDPKA